MTPTRRPDTSHRGSIAGPLFVLVSLVVAGGAIAAAVYLTREGATANASATPAAPPAATAPKPAPKPATPVAVRPKAVEPPAVVAPEPAKPKTFDGVWDDVDKLYPKLAASEPAKSEKQMRLLTSVERMAMPRYVEAVRNQDQQSANLIIIHELIKQGFVDVVTVYSVRVSLQSGEFRQLAGRLWRPGKGTEWMVESMVAWATAAPLFRSLAAKAVMNGTKAEGMYDEVRDLILAMGGREYLLGE